jgi:hypothetical protein
MNNQKGLEALEKNINLKYVLRQYNGQEQKVFDHFEVSLRTAHGIEIINVSLGELLNDKALLSSSDGGLKIQTLGSSTLKLGRVDILKLIEVAYSKSSIRKQSEFTAQNFNNLNLGNSCEVFKAFTGWQSGFVPVNSQTRSASDWKSYISTLRSSFPIYDSVIGPVLSKLVPIDYEMEPKTLELLRKFSENQQSYLLVASSKGNSDQTYLDNDHKIPAKHSMSIRSVNFMAKTLKVENPWDTSAAIELNFEDFQRYFNGLAWTIPA